MIDEQKVRAMLDRARGTLTLPRAEAIAEAVAMGEFVEVVLVARALAQSKVDGLTSAVELIEGFMPANEVEAQFAQSLVTAIRRFV